MFDTFIVQPIYNILVVIYALLPGHDYGVAILLLSLFTKFLMWPIVKKQLHHTKNLRKLQPEISKIRKKYKNDRQKVAQLQMELYKERELNPFAPIGLLLVQMPILIGVYFAVRKLAEDPDTLLNFTYLQVRDLSWIQEIKNTNFEAFDQYFLGWIDLSRTALSDGGTYWPLVVMAVATGLIQFFQTRALLPNTGDKKTLRQVLKEGQKNGGEPDKDDLQAAVGKSTSMILPAVIVFLGLTFPGAVVLYWFSNTVLSYIQNKFVLRSDSEEIDKLKTKTDKKTKTKTVKSKGKPSVKVSTKRTTKKPATKTKKAKK